MDNRRTRWSAIRRPTESWPCHEPCLLPFCSVLGFLIWGKSPPCLLRRGVGGTGRRSVNCGCWAVAGGGL